MLDDRKTAILNAIVEEYIQTGTPVGSQTLVDRHGLSVSAATVRNEMKALERDGFIEQPHTSAGRIPTDVGYRCYVDSVRRSRRLSDPARRVVERFFLNAQSELEALLSSTSRLLADVTEHAAIVVGPRVAERVVKGAHIDRLTDNRILATVVFDTGQVETRCVEAADVITDEDVRTASQILSAALLDRPVSAGFGNLGHAAAATRRSEGATRQRGGASGKPSAPQQPQILDLIAEAFEAVEDVEAPPYFLGGASRTAAAGAFGDPVEIHRVLELLEQQVILVRLFSGAFPPGPVSVMIGGEIPVQELHHCTLVASGFGADGQALGTIGVVGPTRMDYGTVISGVAEISSRLGRVLEFGTAPGSGVRRRLS